VAKIFELFINAYSKYLGVKARDLHNRAQEVQIKCAPDGGILRQNTFRQNYLFGLVNNTAFNRMH
jgi:hypothetical protein